MYADLAHGRSACPAWPACSQVEVLGKKKNRVALGVCACELDAVLMLSCPSEVAEMQARCCGTGQPGPWRWWTCLTWPGRAGLPSLEQLLAATCSFRRLWQLAHLPMGPSSSGRQRTATADLHGVRVLASGVTRSRAVSGGLDQRQQR